MSGVGSAMLRSSYLLQLASPPPGGHSCTSQLRVALVLACSWGRSSGVRRVRTSALAGVQLPRGGWHHRRADQEDR